MSGHYRFSCVESYNQVALGSVVQLYVVDELFRRRLIGYLP